MEGFISKLTWLKKKNPQENIQTESLKNKVKNKKKKKHYIPKFLDAVKGEKVHSNTGLTQETRQILYNLTLYLLKKENYK